jgi:hypothetical protein
VSLLPDRFIDDYAIIVPDSADRAVKMDMYFIDHVRSNRAMLSYMITVSPFCPFGSVCFVF